jgi:hypothetical protein
MPSARLRPLALVVAAALAVGVSLAGFTAAPAHAAGSTALLQDDFTGSTLASNQYSVGGTGTASPGPGTNVACLTVAGSPAGQAPASCPGASDPAGGGALRLTAAAGSQTGYLLYNHALPTKAGLDIDFDSYQWGGNGADGIAFFLSDGAYDLSSVGASGGSLGYSNSLAGSGQGQQGVPHGLIGVALDTYGNYSAESNNTSCNTPSTWTSQTPNEVAVRGPGVQKAGAWNDGYCLLGKAVQVSGSLDKTSATSRGQAARHVRVVVDPPTATTPMVSVYMGAMGDTTTPADQLPLITQVPEPAQLLAATTFKFGWSASTGGSTDYHEINTLKVGTVNPITPSLAEATSDPAAVDAGATSTATFATSTLSTDGPIAAGTPVTMTITKDPSLSFGSLTDQSGWVLQTSSGDTAVYSYTPSAAVVSGTALPHLSIPVTGSVSGAHPLTAVVSGGGIDEVENPAAARTATASITVRPTASPVSDPADATTDPASASPKPFTFDVPAPGGTGGGTPSYALSSTPAAAQGTASIDATTGAVTFTPAAGWSGTATFAYTVSANGATSVPAAITVVTPPAVAAHSVTVPYDTTATVDLSSGAYGSGLSYAVAGAPPSSAGTATISGSTLSVVPAAGFSGTATLSYGAHDSAGVASALKTVTVTVQPEAGSAELPLSLDAAGEGSASSTLPAASGAGPFSYALESDTGVGSLAVDPDGGYSYTAASGHAGVFTGSYTASDAEGVTSPASGITVTVRPYAGAVNATTSAGTPVTTEPPATAGADGGTFALVGPAVGAAIDQSSGSITYTPAAGASGEVSLAYTVTAHGVTSTPAAVTIAVVPTLVDHSSTTLFGQACTVELGEGAVGTDLSYSIVTDAGAAGSSSIDATSGALVFTPAPGFSGVATVSYRATDHDGLNRTRTATITVLPAASSGSGTVTLPPTGDDPSTFALPTPDGSGPFHYQLVPGTTSPGGTLAIDPQTGVVTFTPAPGVSGVVTAKYVVTDGAGNTSPEQTVSITVQPFSSAATSSAAAGARSLRLAVPTSVGTGPFSYALAAGPQGQKGTASIDRATGMITFVPADPTASGTAMFTYTATDANGITVTAEAALEIRPVVADASARTQGAASEPASVRLQPAIVGTGPFVFELVGAAPVHATVRVEGAGFTVQPDAGFDGRIAFSYLVVGADGVGSDPAGAVVTVLPFPAASALASTGTRVSGLALGGALSLLAAGVVLLGARRRRRISA